MTELSPCAIWKRFFDNYHSRQPCVRRAMEMRKAWASSPGLLIAAVSTEVSSPLQAYFLGQNAPQVCLGASEPVAPLAALQVGPGERVEQRDGLQEQVLPQEQAWLRVLVSRPVWLQVRAVPQEQACSRVLVSRPVWLPVPAVEPPLALPLRQVLLPGLDARQLEQQQVSLRAQARHS
jgi:hypothetical protein